MHYVAKYKHAWVRGNTATSQYLSHITAVKYKTPIGRKLVKVKMNKSFSDAFLRLY